MGKIILLLLGILLVYWILRSYRRRPGERDTRPGTGAAEDMVRCAHCGVHLPRSESVMTRGAYYCSVEHQRLHANKG